MTELIKLILDERFYFITREQGNKLNTNHPDIIVDGNNWYVLRNHKSFKFIILKIRGYQNIDSLIKDEYKGMVERDMQLLKQEEPVQEGGENDLFFTVDESDYDENIENRLKDLGMGIDLDLNDNDSVLPNVDQMKNMIKSLLSGGKPLTSDHIPSPTNQAPDNLSDTLNINGILEEINTIGHTETSISLDQLSTNKKLNQMISNFINNDDDNDSDVDSLGFNDTIDEAIEYSFRNDDTDVADLSIYTDKEADTKTKFFQFDAPE